MLWRCQKWAWPEDVIDFEICMSFLSNQWRSQYLNVEPAVWRARRARAYPGSGGGVQGQGPWWRSGGEAPWSWKVMEIAKENVCYFSAYAALVSNNSQSLLSHEKSCGRVTDLWSVTILTSMWLHARGLRNVPAKLVDSPFSHFNVGKATIFLRPDDEARKVQVSRHKSTFIHNRIFSIKDTITRWNVSNLWKW